MFHTLGRDAEVKALRLRDVDIYDVIGRDLNSRRAERQGSLAGENRGRIYDVGVSDVTALIGSDYCRRALKQSRFGGLVGVNSGGEISHSFAQIYVHSFSPDGDALGDILGGLVGRNEGGAKIKNSYTTGAISGHCRLGGLVGEHISANRDSAENISTIENSYAQVDMNKILDLECIDQDFEIAGFVQGFGGLVGFMEQADIVNSYAAARQSGGVLGLIGGTTGTVSVINSYWDNILNDQQSASTTIGETTAFGGQTTAVLQGTTPTMGIYANWSSDDWDFGTNAAVPDTEGCRRSHCDAGIG